MAPAFICDVVISLLGVVLIARPPALFGDAKMEDPVGERFVPMDKGEKGTPTQRLLAVG